MVLPFIEIILYLLVYYTSFDVRVDDQGLGTA